MQQQSSLATIVEEFKAILSDLDPQQKAVSERQQYEFLFALEKSAAFTESFFFVVTMPDFQVTHKFNISKWVCSEVGFTMETYKELLHPTLRSQQIQHARDATKAYAEGKGAVKIKFGEPLFSVIQPIRSEKMGDYLLVKRLVFPFQYYENKLQAYLSHFTIIGPYHNEDLAFHTFSKGHEQILKTAEQQLRQAFLDRLEEGPRRLLEIYRDPKARTIKVACERWGKISEGAVRQYNQKILEQASAFFPSKFSSAVEVAEHLFH